MGRSRPAWPETEVEPGGGNVPIRPVMADVQAFSALYREYLRPIYQYCYRRLRSVEDAEDATSLVFTKALATFSTRRDESVTRSWLFAIAHHVGADRFRGRTAEELLDAAGDLFDQAPSPEDLAETGEASRRLRAALARLSPDQRRVVELRLTGLRLGPSRPPDRIGHPRSGCDRRRLPGDARFRRCRGALRDLSGIRGERRRGFGGDPPRRSVGWNADLPDRTGATSFRLLMMLGHCAWRLTVL